MSGIVIGKLASGAHGERFDGKKMLSVLDVDDGVSIGWELLSGMSSWCPSPLADTVVSGTRLRA
jgi:hypothetical protein